MAQEDVNQFLAHSAYSIKDAITRKLSEDGRFTDQIYEGSNLAILIDIFSYIFQCLTYQLNTAASESMFADTKLYDNIVRLVKFIGYQPKGCSPATLAAYISPSGDKSIRSYWLPPYSRIDTGKTDQNGREIYFSTVCSQAAGTEPFKLDSNDEKQITLYNGEWKLYDTVFTASGVDNETFILDGLRSDADTDEYVAQDFIDVYVLPAQVAGSLDMSGQQIEAWQMDKNGIFMGYYSNDKASGLFNNQSPFKSLYPGTYKVYSAYLNEDKTYEIRFGNGVVGKKLNPGDRVYVFYLDTNGLDGTTDFSDVDISKMKFEHSASMLGITTTFYDELFQVVENNSGLSGETIDKNLASDDNQDIYTLSLNSYRSTQAAVEEDVETIRENAPKWFMTGNRLVTKFDYEYYLKTAQATSIVGSEIVDVKCMNNWDYMQNFYKWLYDLGQNGKYVKYAQQFIDSDIDVTADPRKYLNHSNFIRHNYFFADSADANNLYLWMKTTNDKFDVQNATANVNKILNPIKLMTAELVVCRALNVNFAVCVAPEEYVLQNYIDYTSNGDNEFDSEQNYIEITLDDNTPYVASSMQKDIYNIIVSAFGINQNQLGQAIDYSAILEQIYAIDGVTRVRTVFNPPADSEYKPIFQDGLSFASWTGAGDIIQAGDDLHVGNSIRQLNDFQFPVIYGQENLLGQIKIIKKSLSNVNTIKF